MTNYDIVNEFLSYDSSDDQWEDVDSDFVYSIVKKFEDSDWQALDEGWQKKSALWSERCAQVLDAFVCESAFKILDGMLISDYLGQVINACCSLRTFKYGYDARKYISWDELTRVRVSVENYKTFEANKIEFLETLDHFLKQY